MQKQKNDNNRIKIILLKNKNVFFFHVMILSHK